MSVLKNFKTIPGRPMGGATGPKCIFFFKFTMRFLAKKKQGGLSPPKRATGACRPPQGRQGSVAHQRGDRALSPTRGATASHPKRAKLWVTHAAHRKLKGKPFLFQQ